MWGEKKGEKWGKEKSKRERERERRKVIRIVGVIYDILYVCWLKMVAKRRVRVAKEKLKGEEHKLREW